MGPPPLVELREPSICWSRRKCMSISVFWVSFRLAYDSPGCPCHGTERSILIQRNYPLTANSFYSHTPRQWCCYLFISISSPAHQASPIRAEPGHYKDVRLCRRRRRLLFRDNLSRNSKGVGEGGQFIISDYSSTVFLLCVFPQSNVYNTHLWNPRKRTLRLIHVPLQFPASFLI